MEKCRICLNIRKTMSSIFKKDKGICCADMMTVIANVKISKEDGITSLICQLCYRKLTQAYDFKMLIEKSDAVLNENINRKRVRFNDLNDIKTKIEIGDLIDTKPSTVNCEKFEEIEIKELNYNNTIIKKIECKDKDVIDLKPMPVLDFLQRLKDECSDNDFDDIYDMGQENHECDSDDEYLPINKLKKKHKRKKFDCDVDDDYLPTNKFKKTSKEKKKCKLSKPMTKSKGEDITYIKPTKPVYIEDLRLIPTGQTKTKEKRKKKELKQRVCPYCGKVTKALNVHLRTHIGEKKFKCDQCEKAYFTQAGLRKHLLRHSSIKQFKCDHCTAECHTQRDLDIHMIRHKDEKNYVCDVCSKAYKRRPALHRHKLTHSAKKIMCELCNMSFNTRYNLRHHMRVHTGERPYNCEICSQPYSYKHDFNRHCFKKHGVFLKRRSVYVMNEEVLKQEKLLMRDLMLRVSGIVKDDKPLNPFEGPQASLAFEQAVKALENREISVDFQL